MYGIAYGFLSPRCHDAEDSLNGDSGWSRDSSSSSSKSSSSTRDKLGSAGKSLQRMGKNQSDSAAAIASSIRPVAYKKGGRVRKTGPAIVHKDERVIPASKRKKAEKVMRKAGMSLTNKKRGKKQKDGRKGSGR